MIFVEILKEILIESLTTSSRVNALITLRILASMNDYDAIRALSQALAHELDYDTPDSSFINARSLPELLTAVDIPPFVRVYAAGLSHRDFNNNFETVSQLVNDMLHADAELEEIFSRFQYLIRYNSLLQDEVLRAFVLVQLVFGASLQFREEWRWGREYSSPANLLPIIYDVQTECRIVPGRAAESGLTFGRELIIDLTSVHVLLGIVAHEFGHRTSGMRTVSRAQQKFGIVSAGMTGQQSSTDQMFFQELVDSFPKLLEPLQIASQPGKPNGVDLSSGVKILYSHETLPRGQYTHLSLSDRGLGIDPCQAAICAYFVLLLLDVDLNRAVAFYSPRGVFHFGFPGTGFNIHLLNVESAIENARTKSAPWLDELERSGRLVWRSEDFKVALGLQDRRPIYIGPPSKIILEDLSVYTQLRANKIVITPNDPLNNFLCSAVRCADVPVVQAMLKAMFETGLVPNIYTGDSKQCVLHAGTSFCIIDDGEQKTYYGPAASDILAVMDALHAFGLNLDEPIDDDKNTFLISVAGRSVQLTQFLLAHGASPNQPNSRGQTALHVAAQHGSIAIVRQLLQAGATVDVASLDGTTALMLAAENGFPDVVNVLLERGADPSATTSLGWTAIHLAVLSSKTQSQSACIQALLEAGADIDEETNGGKTPLILASALGLIEVVEMLIACGADIHARTVDGATALMLASEQVIPILARAGAI